MIGEQEVYNFLTTWSTRVTNIRAGENNAVFTKGDYYEEKWGIICSAYVQVHHQLIYDTNTFTQTRMHAYSQLIACRL